MGIVLTSTDMPDPARAMQANHTCEFEIVLRYACALVAVMLCVLIPVSAGAHSAQSVRRISEAASRTVAGIEVLIDARRAPSWISCSAVNERHLPRAMAAVHQFASKYNALARSALRRVVLCGRLGTGENQWIRGVYDADAASIIIELDDFDDTLYVLHHEFSSLLMLASGDMTSFRALWRRYSRGSYNADFQLAARQDWRPNPQLYRRGFLHAYSATSFENDLNVMVAFVMSDYLRPRLQAASRFAAIRAKVKLTEDFLRRWTRPVSVAQRATD